MDLHPMINEFPLGEVKTDPDFHSYFTGAKFRKDVAEFFPRAGRLSGGMEQCLPSTFGGLDATPDQEHFEFIPLFEAVTAADGEFSMIDLGAGYGLWSIHAACLARRRGIPFHLAMVEAEPRHFELLRQALADNDVSEGRCDLYEAAIETEDAIIASGPSREALVPFIVAQPTGSTGNRTPWIGQSTGPGAKMFCANAKKTGRTYHGKDVYETADGWQLVHLPLISLRSILERRERIDLLVMDIQGSELAAIKSCKDLLSRHVGRVSIATHGADMESGIHDIFTALGWEKLLDFTHNTAASTRMGKVFFRDGLLYFRNPAFTSTNPDSDFFLTPFPASASIIGSPIPSSAGASALPILSKSGMELSRLWRKLFFRREVDQDAFRTVDTVCLVKPTTRQDYVALVGFAVTAEQSASLTLRFEFTFPKGAPGVVHWYVRVSDGDWNPLGDFVLRDDGGVEGMFACHRDIKADVVSNTVNIVFYPLEEGAWHVLPVSVAIYLLTN